MEKKEKKGKLYIVSTHIGNKEDITIRASEVLKICDLVICEELKVGAKILRDLSINKKLETMNEQNESEKVFEFIQMIKEGKKLAVISDCGTPIFADPGSELLKNALVSDIDIVVVPGVSSLMTALVRSGFALDRFLYAGFPPRTTEDRLKYLQTLSKEPYTVALYDTPYRLLPVLEAACKIMPHRRVYIGMNLTMAFETHHYGTFQELYEKFKDERIKAEFVIVIEGATPTEHIRKNEDFKFERFGDDRRRDFKPRRGRSRFDKGGKSNFGRRKPFDKRASDRKFSDRKFSDRKSSGRSKFSDKK